MSLTGGLFVNVLSFLQAEEFGILFMPSQKKYEGKTLYTFGSASVYIDRGVLFVMRDHKWTPISLEELIEYVT